MSGKNKSNTHHRRSSLPNLKTMPSTIADRRLFARQKRQQQQEAAKLAKQKAAEEKRQRAKILRKNTRVKDSSNRRPMTILGSLIHCSYCDEMIEKMEFDEHKVSHPTQIRSRIWLGNGENSRDIKVMKKCGITHILNCTKEIELTRTVSKKLKSFKRISIQDKNHETILDYINEANAFIEKALGQNKFNVLFVHCREGRSRSVSFLSAYLMWKERQSFHAILSDITSKRPIVLPNNKFFAELETFDKQIIVDRKNKCRKFGRPNTKFKLEKCATKKVNGEHHGSHSFDFTNHFDQMDLYDDEIKCDELNDLGSYEIAEPPKRYRDRRRSSMSDIESYANTVNRITPNSNSDGCGLSLTLANGWSAAPNDTGNGTALSPVAGSPAAKPTKKKKEREWDPWSDLIFDNKKGNKYRKNGKKKGDKKRNSKKNGLQFNVEDALDVIDIFGRQNSGDLRKKTKKKTSKKERVKRKKRKTV